MLLLPCCNLFSFQFIDLYIKAEDPSNYAEVIELVTRADKYNDLVLFLQMTRKSLREPRLTRNLPMHTRRPIVYMTWRDFLSMTNVADILEVGEKCFNDELYQAAKLLFTNISNWARLATTLI